MNEEQAREFEMAGKEVPPGVGREFLLFLKQNKKFWLIPLLAALFLLALIGVVGGTAAAPFIYTLF